MLLLVLSISAMSQDAFHNSGNLQLHTGAVVTGFGNFTNSSSGLFLNNGSIYVRGNISNDQPSMTVGTGILYLNGSSTQAINGTQVFKTYDLVTNNASGITLNNNLSVSGTHTYTSGMVTTSATPNYMIYEAGSSYSGSADSRHVNGWVKKTGNTNFVFPVGNAIYERPVELTNLSASAEFSVRHNGAVTPGYASVYNPIVLVDTSEYWTVNRVSGAAAAQVTMNWNTSKIPFPMVQLTHIRATYWDGIFWRGIGGSATGSVLTTGSVTSNSTSIFNTNFVIGSISFVLPLQIISFTAGRMNDHTKLNWTIGNELDVDRYELQRSDDGINFYTISLQSPYNRNGTEFYNYNDIKILKGTAFYRLKLTNISNQVIYSHIVSVSENNISKDFYVITNPIDESIDIYANASVKGVYNYTIAGTSGQVMQSGILDIKYGGIYSIHLRPVFSPGAYILLVKNETNILQKTIIKK